MKSSAEPRSRLGWKLTLTAIVLGMFAAVSLTGCPGTPIGGGGGDDGDQEEPAPSPVRAEMISPSTGFGLSALDPPVSFFYSVDESATDVRGFRVPVADESLNSAPIGERVITATNLAVGDHQVFSFDPGEAGVGFFRVGILFLLDGVEDDAESQAVIHVQGTPDPIFILPTEALTQVQKGTEVTVSCNVNDPEGDVQWRLFYLSETDLRNVLEDRLGTALATGTGNAVTFNFNTKSLDPGVYQLGISATDSGASIAATVASGRSDRIVTIPNTTTTTPILRVIVPMPPTIEVTEPATTVTIPTGGSFTIRFTGTILEPDAPETMGTIEIFYDLDDNVGNGFATIAADLPISTPSVQFPTDVLSGTYFIGATIFDGINSAVTDYASGKIIVTP